MKKKKKSDVGMLTSSDGLMVDLNGQGIPKNHIYYVYNV